MKDVVEIYEDAQTWKRIASMWQVCTKNAKYKCFTERTWAVMPKVCGHIHTRCRDHAGTIGLEGTRDGWGIVTGWLAQINWGQVVTEHGNQVFNRAEQKWAGELGHRLILGTTVCDSFQEGG